jgi:hypothetical protein
MRSILRPMPNVEATSYDILAVNQNTYMKSETFPPSITSTYI